MRILIACIWAINGLICKVLHLAPRHEAIVHRITKSEYSSQITIAIGVSEVMMAVWIVSGIWPRTNTIFQIIIIATMNALEFFLAPDLLLWGHANALFAFLLILAIAYAGVPSCTTTQPATQHG